MIYDLIAPIYDGINREIDYSKWADFIEAAVNKYSAFTKGALALDLGCGTGKMTVELARRGYDMTGVDYSAEMLDVAREYAENSGFSESILWLCQDMREFELYGTVDFAVSCLDCMNHLTSPSDFLRCLSLVHNYLVPNGIFIFDVNGLKKFREVYAQNSYVMENDGSMCVWQNYYNEKSKNCDFYITLFKEDEDGRYERYDEIQRERAYSIRAIKGMLEKNSLEFIGAYSDFDFAPATDESERIFIIAKCVKE